MYGIERWPHGQRAGSDHGGAESGSALYAMREIRTIPSRAINALSFSIAFHALSMRDLHRWREGR